MRSTKSQEIYLIYPKIPISYQIEDIRGQMRKWPGIPLKDLRVTQPLPNRDVKGKWKYMTCVGPTTAWRRSLRHVRREVSLENEHCSPSTSYSFFRCPWRHASLRNSKTRWPSKASHPTSVSTTSQCPPSPTTSQHATMIPPPPPHTHTHGSFVQGPPPPPHPWHPGPPSPPLAGLWHSRPREKNWQA